MKTIQWQNRKFFPVRDGFTLVEIMMVIMLVGILAGMTAPPMFKYLEANRMRTRTDRMVADLQFARAVAISTGQAHRFANTASGYTLTNLVTGGVLRDVDFAHGSELDDNLIADFFPWGMATSTTYNIRLNDMHNEIRVLPTGMVEVETI